MSEAIDNGNQCLSNWSDWGKPCSLELELKWTWIKFKNSMAGNLWSSSVWATVATGPLDNGKVWAIGATGIYFETLKLLKWTSIYSRFSEQEFTKFMSEQLEQLGASGSLCPYLGRNMTHVAEVECVHGFIVIREEKFGLFEFLALVRVSLDDHGQAGSNSQSHSQWAIVQLHHRSKVLMHVQEYEQKGVRFKLNSPFSQRFWITYTWLLEGNVEVWKKNFYIGS